MIDFKTSGYFNGMPLVVGYLLIPLGILLLFSPKMIFGAVLLATGLTVVTTHYRLSVNTSTKQYSEYISLLGMKVSRETHAYAQINYLFIKRVMVSQTLNSRVSSTTVRKEQYEGYLKFSEEDKVHLLTKESKTALLKSLRPIASRLATRIIDYTTETPAEVN